MVLIELILAFSGLALLLWIVLHLSFPPEERRHLAREWQREAQENENPFDSEEDLP